MLHHHSNAPYSFLEGIAPYSCGAIADDGHEIIHAKLEQPLPWDHGMEGIARYLNNQRLAVSALCGVELRCPSPYTMDGFIGFNRAYGDVLSKMGLLLAGVNPIARTNVAPVANAPQSPQLVGFSYVAPIERQVRESHFRTFIVAGAGELVDGKLESEGIICRGQTDSTALKTKAVFVAKIMQERVLGLGASMECISRINLYTAHSIGSEIWECIVERLPMADALGCHWYYTRPPVREIEFEMDLRGVTNEQLVAL